VTLCARRRGRAASSCVGDLDFPLGLPLRRRMGLGMLSRSFVLGGGDEFDAVRHRSAVRPPVHSDEREHGGARSCSTSMSRAGRADGDSSPVPHRPSVASLRLPRSDTGKPPPPPPPPPSLDPPASAVMNNWWVGESLTAHLVPPRVSIRTGETFPAVSRRNSAARPPTPSSLAMSKDAVVDGPAHPRDRRKSMDPHAGRFTCGVPFPSPRWRNSP